jgi:hypothetical protein
LLRAAPPCCHMISDRARGPVPTDTARRLSSRHPPRLWLPDPCVTSTEALHAVEELSTHVDGAAC